MTAYTHKLLLLLAPYDIPTVDIIGLGYVHRRFLLFRPGDKSVTVKLCTVLFRASIRRIRIDYGATLKLHIAIVAAGNYYVIAGKFLQRQEAIPLRYSLQFYPVAWDFSYFPQAY